MSDEANLSEAVSSLEQIPPEVENQELKETIEIVFQITAGLDVENIIKNVVWSFLSKFQI
jgi:hypothetical protein